MTKGQSTEVDAYVFIKERLGKLGWEVKNPSRSANGQVYTQNECLSNPHIQKQLGNLKPENIVKINETTFWVIEAKKDRTRLNIALKEAKDYAILINKSNVINAPFITGLAGNDLDGYIMKSMYLNIKGNYETITLNNHEVTGLLSPEVIRTIMFHNSASINDVPVDEKHFLHTAEEINKYLHIGGINKNYRARVMAALLLSLAEDDPPNLNSSPSVLIRDINSRAQRILELNGKSEFYSKIRIDLPTNPDNHVKFKNALINTLQSLNDLNIRSAMNSGTDVLGKFYEVFLKYGNGAKEIGIVLTPRHITKFAAEILDVTHKDIVYDPTAGTGGFLVAALDRVRLNSSNDQFNVFKENNVFGIDQEGEVAALAIVNMIFRGDGKNNIKEGNCFSQHLEKKTIDGHITASYTSKKQDNDKKPISRVLMNPPFALKKNDEREYKFVQAALNQMEDGGLLFSVLPLSTLFEGGEEKEWRENTLLKDNTLLSVVTFPLNLFQPTASTCTIGMIIKKGIPHPKDQNVLWCKVEHDGMVLKKNKRLPNSQEPNQLNEVTNIVKNFISSPKMKIESKPEYIKASPVDYSDPLLELVPEAYLDTKEYSIIDIQKAGEELIRETVATIIRDRRENHYLK